MQPRAAQGYTYTAYLQKRKMLWRIRSLAVQIEARTSPGCPGNRNGAKLEFPSRTLLGRSVNTAWPRSYRGRAAVCTLALYLLYRHRQVAQISRIRCILCYRAQLR